MKKLDANKVHVQSGEQSDKEKENDTPSKCESKMENDAGADRPIGATCSTLCECNDAECGPVEEDGRTD